MTDPRPTAAERRRAIERMTMDYPVVLETPPDPAKQPPKK